MRTDRNEPRREDAGPLRDLLAISLAAVVLFWLGRKTNFFMAANSWMRRDLPIEPYEVIAGFALLAIGFAIFAVRRWREARRGIAARDETERRLRTLVEHIPAITYTWDSTQPAGAVAPPYVSPQIEAVLGYTPEEWESDPQMWIRSVHPEDRDRFVTTSDLSDRTGQPFCEEYRVIAKDGRVVWLRDEAVPVAWDASGRATSFQGVMYDVTERKHAEQQLQETEARYRTLVERVPAITYVWDASFPTGTVATPYVSPQVETILGFTQEEWQADPQTWHRQIHPDDRERVLAEWEISDREGLPFGAEYRLFTKDGRTVWIRDEAVLVSRGDSGRPLFQGVMFDITERKWAEKLLREAEAKYRTLVEQIPVVTYVTDAVVEEGTPLRYVSPRVRDVLGFTQEEWIGDPGIWQRQLHPDDRERVVAEADRTDATGEPFSMEYRLLAKDGHVVWVRDEAVLLRWGPTGTQTAWQGVYLDITRRKEAEERLHEAEGRYRTLVEQLPAVTYVEEAAGGNHFRYISPQIEEMLGFAQEEWIGDPELWSRQLHADDYDRVMAEDARVEETGDPYSIDYRIFTKDGRPLWVHNEAVLVRDAEGMPLYWQGVVLDVTERKEVEGRLHEAEARYRTLVEQLPAVAYIDALDANATSVYMSPQVLSMLGYSPEEWMTDPDFWADHLHPDDRERALDANARHNETGEPFDMEYRLIARDGRTVWVRDQAVVVRDDQDGPRFSQGIMLDVTERREAEELLRETEAKYRALVEQIPAVLYIDLPDPEMTPIYVSPQVEKMLGIPAHDYVVDDLWEAYLHPEDRERAVAESLAGAESGEPFSTDYRMVTPDGREVWIHDEAVVVHDDEGHPSFVQGVMFDITERKRAEEALRESERRERDAAERLRTLDEMKNTFLAAVSHELRSPLTSILGLALTLEQQEFAQDDRRDLLGRLASNARKLDRLLKDLLDIDRLNRGIVTPQYRPTDVGALVRRTVKSLEILAGRSIVVEADPVVTPVDPAKVERIVENLLANAVRHTSPETGLWVLVQSQDGGVLIAVEDDGPGVPVELRREVFEPFRQGPTASPHTPGTGIGLSLVAMFAELHGGRAWVQDREGGGASFRVFLPGASTSGNGGPIGSVEPLESSNRARLDAAGAG